MGIVFRQSAKNSIIVVAGALLGALIVWLSTKYIPNQREYGFTQGLIFWAITLSQLLLVGVNSTLAVYVHKFADNDAKRKLLITISLLLPSVFTVLFTILYYLFRAKIIAHFQPVDRAIMNRYFIWFPVSALIFIYVALLELYLGSQMKVAIASFMREIVLRVFNIILLALYALHKIEFDVLVAGLVLIYLIPVSLFFVISFKTKGFGFSFNFHTFSRAEYKELIHFSWYHFLLSISLILLSYMDMLLLPFYDHSGYASVAIYRVAIFLIALLQLPSKAFLPASFSALAKAFAEKEMAQARDIFERSSINLFIPTMGIALLLACNLNNALAIMPNSYSEIIPIFYILFIGNIVNLATGMNDQVLTIANYYKFNFYLSLMLIGGQFLLIKFLVPHYGVFGAAWSTTSIVVLFNIVKFVFIWRKLDMQPFSHKTIRVILAAIPAFIAGHYLPYFFNPVADAAVRSSAVIIVYLLMVYWLKPSPDLTVYLASIRKNKRLF